MSHTAGIFSYTGPKAAYDQFQKLEGVDDDPARTSNLSDLVFIAQFEIDLVEAGESTIDVRPHRRFVKKWGKQ